MLSSCKGGLVAQSPIQIDTKFPCVYIATLSGETLSMAEKIKANLKNTELEKGNQAKSTSGTVFNYYTYILVID